MTRHPAGLCLVLLPALAACGGPPRDTAAPPPITADTPAEPTPIPSPSAAPVPSPTSAPTAETIPPQPATPATITTSAPGAIPPAPLPGAAAQPSPSPEPPLQWLHDKQAQKAEYDRKVRDAEAAVAAARPEVDRWEKNVLAIKNPFLPPPRFTAEESEATKGMTNVERLKYAQDKLAAAKETLAGAQKTLDDLKANPVSL